MRTQTLHYPHPTGFALAGTVGILYTVCAAVVSLWPMQIIRFFNGWMHAIDLSRIYIPPQITIGSFLLGLLGVMVTAYVTGFVFAWIYNKCVAHCKRKGWI